MIRAKYIDIPDVKIIHRAERAVSVQRPYVKRVWAPLSQLDAGTQPAVGGVGTIRMAEWLALKNGVVDSAAPPNKPASLRPRFRGWEEMRYRPDLELSAIPYDILQSVAARQRRKRQSKPPSPGVLRLCPFRGKEFGARRLRAHQPGRRKAQGTQRQPPPHPPEVPYHLQPLWMRMSRRRIGTLM